MSAQWPTEGHFRTAWIEQRLHLVINLGRPQNEIAREAAAEFDTWLARVRAEAWQEAADEIAQQGTIQIPDNPYQEKGEDAEGGA